MHERRLPENVNVTISNPGIGALQTDVTALRAEVSTVLLSLVAIQRQVNTKLNAILDLLSGGGLTPSQVEQIKRIGDKVEAIDKKETE